MRWVAATVIGVVAGLALMFLLSLLVGVAGRYSPVIAAIVSGLFVALALGTLSRETGLIIGGVVGLIVGIAVGLVLVFLPMFATGVAVEQVAAIIIVVFSYFMAGFAAGAFFGASYEHGYGWGSGTLIPGLLAGILLLGAVVLLQSHFYIYRLAAAGALTDVAATVLLVISALALGAWGGAVGGQVSGARP